MHDTSGDAVASSAAGSRCFPGWEIILTYPPTTDRGIISTPPCSDIVHHDMCSEHKLTSDATEIQHKPVQVSWLMSVGMLAPGTVRGVTPDELNPDELT